LQLKIKCVSDGKIADMEEAVEQAAHSTVSPLPPAVQVLNDVVERTESAVEQAGKFVDTINDICGKLVFLQDLGDKLSEVGYDAV
jgi:hypothetical protein